MYDGSVEDNEATTQPQPSQESMAGLSRGFYEIAHELIMRMWKLGLREGGTYKYTASVVVLLHACLEAYINEFLALHRKLNSNEIEPKLIALCLGGRSAVEDKWFKIPLLFGENTFDKGAEPFQSFSLLVSLRNVLGHYDAQFRTNAEFPKNIASLSSKFAFSYGGKSDWTSQALNFECARWACRTVKVLIPRFHEFVGGRDDSSSPYPWPDPP
jgi:hypothetical protein